MYVRCDQLNLWMNSIIKAYPNMKKDAQLIISQFLSWSENDETVEHNKDQILSL